MFCSVLVCTYDSDNYPVAYTVLYVSPFHIVMSSVDLFRELLEHLETISSYRSQTRLCLRNSEQTKGVVHISHPDHRSVGAELV